MTTPPPLAWRYVVRFAGADGRVRELPADTIHQAQRMAEHKIRAGTQDVEVVAIGLVTSLGEA